MCGGKTSKESQTYTPNAAVGAGGTGALTLASNYANSPYSMPLQQIAGFTPLQQQAFNQTVQQQGAWSPFVNQANNYFTQSAQPVSDNDIAQYLNPYKENVMADLKDVFGSQMKQATDSAVTNAGGVGANRVGVAQANLGKQQGLAAGTILSGIYDRALAAAQQDKTRQQTAGYGVGQLAPMTSQLGYTDTSNLYNMGSQQQQLNQAGLNAQYQWDVGKVMDPATKAQFQAQITGGLAPAMGGTTVTEKPGPSPWSQIAGAGMAAAGAFMGNPAMISGGLNSAFGGGGGGQMGGTGQGWFGYGAQPGQQVQGGYGSYWAPSPNGGLAPRFYSEGGEVNPYDAGQRFDEGGDVLPRPTPFPGGIFGGLGGDPQSDWTPSPEAQRRIQGAFDDIGGLPPEIATGQSRPTPQPESALPFTDIGPPVTYRPPPGTTLGRPTQPAPAPLPDLEGPAHTGYDFAQGRPEENQYDRFAASPWFALMNAGLATMASTSPFALTNIGKGALAGVDTVRKQQGEALSRRRIKHEATRLLFQANADRRAESANKRAEQIHPLTLSGLNQQQSIAATRESREASRFPIDIASIEQQQRLAREKADREAALHPGQVASQDIQIQQGQLALRQLEAGSAALNDPEFLNSMGISQGQAAALGPDGVRQVIRDRITNRYDVKDFNGDVWAIDRLSPRNSFQLQNRRGLESYGITPVPAQPGERPPPPAGGILGGQQGTIAIPGQPGQPGGVPSRRTGVSNVPNYTGGFGPASFLTWANLKVPDVLSGDVTDRTFRDTQARNGLNILREKIVASLSHDNAGGRLASVQAAIRRILPEPGKFFTGPQEGLAALSEVRKMLTDDIDRHMRTMSAPAFRAPAREKAAQAIHELQSTRAQVDDVIRFMSIPNAIMTNPTLRLVNNRILYEDPATKRVMEWTGRRQ